MRRGRVACTSRRTRRKYRRYHPSWFSTGSRGDRNRYKRTGTSGRESHQQCRSDPYLRLVVPPTYRCGLLTHVVVRNEQRPNHELTEVLCPSCDNACFRRSVVVATKKIAEKRLSDRQSVQQYVRDRAHWDFWQSKVASSGTPDDEAAFLMSSETPVTSHLIQSSIEPVSWEPYCPVCGCDESDNEFDFHHWDYERDIGVQICRDCHDYAHDGRRVSDTSGSGWETEALKRLITRMKEKEPDNRLSERRLNFPSEKRAAKQCD